MLLNCLLIEFVTCSIFSPFCGLLSIKKKRKKAPNWFPFVTDFMHKPGFDC